MKINLGISACFLLIGALCVNGAAHFFHPSYRYYRQNIEALNSRMDAFESQVRDDFVPAISQLATNLQFRAFSSLPSVASPTIDEDRMRQANRVTIPARFSFFRSQGIDVTGFTYGNRLFTIGDCFLGSVIVYIDETCAKMADGSVYVFSDYDPNYTPKTKEVVKNG